MIMKNILGNAPESWISSIIAGCGASICAIILSQSITFGWYRKDSLDFSSHTQSFCLLLAGLALMMVSIFVRQVLARLSNIEKEIERMRWEQSSPPQKISLIP